MTVIAPTASLRAVRTTQLLYTGLFFGFGVHLPFLTLYLREAGFDAASLGAYFSLFPLARIVVPPLLGFWADAGWGGLRLLRVAALLSLAGAILMGFVWSDGASAKEAMLFGYLAVGIFAAGRAPIVPLADGIALSALGKSDPILFGRMRYFGSASFWVAALLCAVAHDFFGGRAFEVSLWASMLLAVVVSFWAKPFELQITRPTLQDFWRMVKAPSFFLFLCVSFFVKIAEGPFDVYLGPRLASVGASWLMIALAWAFSILPEILVFAYGGSWMSKIGLHRVIPFCILMASLRWMILGSSDSLWVLLLSQPLHAFSFAAFYSGSVAYIARSTSESLRHSAQAVFGAFVYGFGGMLGARLAGFLVSVYSIKITFFCGALVSLTASVFMWGVLRASNRPGTSPP